MTGERRYTVGTLTALWSLSRGTCYAPACPEPAVRMLEGVPFVNLQIAHIYALKVDGPRGTGGKNDEWRNSYRNLMLLCTPHHVKIDQAPDEHPAHLLFGWKQDKERDLAPDLATLSWLSPESLQEIVTDAIGTIEEQLAQSVAQLREIEPHLAQTVERFVAAVGGATGLAIDPDSAALVYDAGLKLGHLKDTAYVLKEAAETLAGLHDTASMLASAVQDTRGLQDVADQLSSAALTIRNTYDS